MSNECSKAFIRRSSDLAFSSKYLVGDGLDVGSGRDGLNDQKELWPLMTSVLDWDLPNGDAQLMESVPDETYDFVHSSHCLEHMVDPQQALFNWFRILKPGGHLIVLIPDEDLYEQGSWPSRYNSDHKWTFTIWKSKSWSPVSRNVVDLIASLEDVIVKKIELLDRGFRHSKRGNDQTLGMLGECAIEFVLKKQ